MLVVMGTGIAIRTWRDYRARRSYRHNHSHNYTTYYRPTRCIPGAREAGNPKIVSEQVCHGSNVRCAALTYPAANARQGVNFPTNFRPLGACGRRKDCGRGSPTSNQEDVNYAR